ncbi:MAG: hypothetical protein K1Y36_09960 [Blastocatellia bacterium]|nr:hypothetical protein [Blastocatellia bacterium]
MSKARLLRALSRVVTGFTILYISSFMICSGWVWYQRGAVNRSWAQTELPLENFSHRFPPTKPNQTALQLQEIGKRFDLMFIRTQTQQDRNLIESMLRTTRLVGDYVQSQVQKNSSELDPLPPALQQFMASHQADLQALKHVLEANPAPVWEMDLALAEQAETPNLLACRGLASLLAVDILENTRQGKHQEALRSFELSWKANESLRNRPELISQLIAVAVDNLNLDILARMEQVPVEWQQRIAAHNYHTSIAVAIEAETWMLYERTKSGEIVLRGTEAETPTNKLFRSTVVALTEPYVKTLMLNAVEAQCRTLAVARNRGNYWFDWKGTVSHSRNPVSNLYAVNGASAWRTMNRHLMQVEKTQKILSIKAQALDGYFPKMISGIESSANPNGKWNYEVAPDGTAKLSFSQEVEFLPLKFTFKPRT